MLWLKQILRKIFLEDWVMKLVALAITLALWLGVTGLSKPVTLRLTSIPLNVRYSNNLEVTNSPIKEVNLVVTGDSRRLAQVNEKNLEAWIDVSEIMPGDRLIPLTPETVVVISLTTGERLDSIRGVKLDEVQPRNMTVKIEAVEEKEVAVQPETYGQLPAGYEIYDKVVTPAKVRVRGPAGFIRTLESVSTERISLSDRLTDFSVRQIPISVSNPKAILSETVVDVTFKIGEQRVERVFHVPIADGSGRRADVKLFGGKSLFQNLRVADLKIEVDKNSDDDDTARVILPAALDGKVEVRSVLLR
jgi:YbbR domain-containing protein